MNYKAACREVNVVLGEIAQIVNARSTTHDYHLERVAKDIEILIRGIFSKEPNSEMAKHWLEEYDDTATSFGLNIYSYDAQIFQWSQFLRRLITDLERRERLEEQSKPVHLSYKHLFYITLLLVLSGVIWMVPVLIEKSNWYWQMVVQVLATTVVCGIYLKFDKREWIKSVGVVLIGLVFIQLLRQSGWEQQLITAGWTLTGGFILAYFLYLGWNK